MSPDGSMVRKVLPFVALSIGVVAWLIAAAGFRPSPTVLRRSAGE
jgi:hypothetical protein